MKSISVLLALLCGALAFFPAAVMALTVIQASNDTVSLIPYVTSMGNDETPTNSLALTPEQVANLKPFSVEASQFPLESPLSAGKVDTHAVNLPALTQPLFVIGDDTFSLQWLQQNTAALKKMHAVGLITNVGSELRYKTIEQTSGWVLLPVSLEGIESLVPVTHLPFLLTATAVMQ